jgi:predicted patatin/cPLA2 family phospholipase
MSAPRNSYQYSMNNQTFEQPHQYPNQSEPVPVTQYITSENESLQLHNMIHAKDYEINKLKADIAALNEHYRVSNNQQKKQIESLNNKLGTKTK